MVQEEDLDEYVFSEQVYPPPRSPGMSEEIYQKAVRKGITPIQLKFEDLRFSVKIKNRVKGFGPFAKYEESEKEILCGIDGTVEPGELLAIMGSSGAGKTTLLNTLAGRSVGKTSGKILFNGKERYEARKFLKRQQAYVMQDDLLLRTQTPEEVLNFSAKLRIPNTVSEENRNNRVEDIIDDLNINNCRNTYIGEPGVRRGISGGERKRVSIGVELITNPSLLFVDEPTTGLDSFTAETVMSTLRELAKSGRTVVCTIHQPNSDIFKLFDKLLLLAKGEPVYFGPASEVCEYFGNLGYPCPEYVNPADFLIKLIHIDFSFPTTAKRVEQLAISYKKSPMYQAQRDAVIADIPLPKEKDKHSGYAQSKWTQLKLLCQRSFKDYIREPMKIRASLGQTIILGLLISFIYLQIGESQESIQNRQGALFFIVVNQSMSSILILVNLFPSERPLFLRESANNMYHPLSFYISKVVSDLPFQLFYPFLFGTVTYFMIGFQYEAEKYFIYIAGVIFTANVAASLGLLIGILAVNSSVAVAVTPMILIPFMLFSGFFLNAENVPPYFLWVEYLSFIRYGFRIVALNEFRGLDFDCGDSGSRCIKTGERVLENLSFDGESIYTNFIILAAMWVAYRTLGYLALIWRVKKMKSNAQH